MPFQRLYSMCPCETSVSVHHEGYMLRYRSLPQGTNQELAEVHNTPLHRRRLQKPSADLRKVHRRHGWDLPLLPDRSDVELLLNSDKDSKAKARAISQLSKSTSIRNLTSVSRHNEERQLGI